MTRETFGAMGHATAAVWRRDTVDVLGVHVSRADADTLRRLMAAAIDARERLTVTFANPDYVRKAAKDAELRDMINSFDLVLADGWGVVAAARLFGRPVPGRMANDDLTDELFGVPAREGWSVYLFGNAPGVASAAAANLERWYPGLKIAGTEHGHWAGPDGRIPDDVAELLIKDINAARPDILHVGLGTPLQQRFVTRYRDRLEVPVIFTCGAYFEHLAERRHYYPRWVSVLRVGFLYRLAREPRRLWRRYTIELASYIGRVLAHRISKGRQI